MNWKLLLAGSVVLTLNSGYVLGITRIVPSEAPTIQHGIWASTDGDTVLVLAGTYVENILINKDIVVRSADGPAVTVIDGGSPANPDSATVVWMSEGSIEGFSIRNGTGTFFPQDSRAAGGILVRADVPPGPLIHSNWIHDNHLVGFNVHVAGIRIHGSAVVISNRIFGNTVDSDIGSSGAAIGVEGPFSPGWPLIEDNEIFDNHNLPPSTGPGGVYAEAADVRRNLLACNSGGDAFPTGHPRSSALFGTGVIEGNTVVGNWNYYEEDPRSIAAVEIAGGPDRTVAFIRNNITHNMGPGLECWQYIFPPFATFIVECNNIAGNFPGGQVVGECSDIIGQDGNISVDPLYGRWGCPHQSGYWCLSENSPLILDPPIGCGLIGATELCPPIGIRDTRPSAPRFQAGAPRPNPFIERTTIPFYLAEGSEVEIGIYGVLGRRLRLLKTGWLHAGDHELVWDGQDEDGRKVASGAYVARIQAGGEELTRTLLLIR